VACALARRAFNFGFLAFAIVAFLKIPGVATRFVESLEADGACAGKSIVSGLTLAISEMNRSSSEVAAGAQIHRQRMGAVLGPTICAKRFQIEAGGTTPIKLADQLIATLRPLEKKTPKFTSSVDGAHAHIQAYNVWLRRFVAELGYAEKEPYVLLHILRKHIIAETIGVALGHMPDGVIEAETSLDSFSSSSWLRKGDSMARLRELVPSEAEYLRSLGEILRPWQLSLPCFVCSDSI